MTYKNLILATAFLCTTQPAIYSAPDINTFVDPYDIEFVRLKSLDGNKYLIHCAGDAVTTYKSDLSLRDLEGHWFITRSAEPSEYWIRNRLSGESLHIENQTGLLEVAPLESDYTSHRWFFEPSSDYFRIRNSRQSDQYISTSDRSDLTAQTTLLYPNSLSQRFQLEAIPRGATLPWTRYDETNVNSVSAPAEIIQQTYTAVLDRNSPAAEAHNGGCILLNGFGTQAQWTVLEAADALTLRYSLLDGESGSITLSIIPTSGGATRTQTIPLDSAQAWIYFDQGEEYNTPAPGRVPAKRFADARVQLSAAIQPGDTIRLSRETADNLVWIDCIDAELQTTHTPPSGAFDVTAAPWSAVGNGIHDDTTAIQNCINAAASAGASVFIPAGRYNIRAELVLPSNTRLEGEGIWHTELFFSKTGNFLDGGIRADGSDIELRHFYLAGAQEDREEGFHGIKGLWAGQSMIEHIWIENTETGMWISDLTSPYGFADGLIIRHCRIRNTFADGINLASGTRNALIENCHVRAAGDDALASWSSGFNRGVGMTSNNQIRYNTIECGWRAGALAVFGGEGHKIHHNLVSDQYIGAGIRGSTLFFFTNGTGSTRLGYDFGDNEPMRIYENTLQRVGARGLFGGELGAIDFQSGYGDLKNIIVENISIEQTHFSGIRLNGAFVNASPEPEFSNIEFRNIQIIDAPRGTRLTGSARGAASFESVEIQPESTPEFINEANNFLVHEVGSFIQFTISGADTVVSEQGVQDTYSVKLLAAPTSDVTITMQTDGQVATSPSSLVFSPGNWNNSQTATISAVDDDVEEGIHSSNILPSASSADSRFTENALPDIDVRLFDNDQNQAPEVEILSPQRVAIPSGVGLLLEAAINDDGKPASAPLTAAWTVTAKPQGASVTFDDIHSQNTGARFDLAGSYTLRLTASDTALSADAQVVVQYGASDGSDLLSGGDIGGVGQSGGLSLESGTYTITGSGADVWNQSDQFFFYSAPFQGDESIAIRILSQSNTFPWAKAGLMIRDSLAPESSHALISVTPSNGLAFQNRPSSGSISFHNDAGAYNFPQWLKLERIGTVISAYCSEDGLNWQSLGSTQPSMSGSDQIGIFLTSHNNGALGTATFDNLTTGAFNLAPSIQALNPLIERIGDSFTINGSVNDDGLPSPASLTTTWTQQEGAGSLSIIDNQVASDVSGAYTLRLIADDGATRSFRDVPLTILSQLEGWQIDQFGSLDASDAGSEDDPDRDGLNNLLEFALGGDPNDGSDAGAIQPSGQIEMHAGSQHLQFSYRKLISPYSEINYTVQFSETLKSDSWQTGNEYFEMVGSPSDNGDGTETVHVRLIQNVESAPKQFVRVDLEM